MRQKFLVTVLILAFCLPLKSLAALSHEATVSGVVESFNERQVTLSSHGRKFVVVRAAIPQNVKLEVKKKMRFNVKIDLLKNVAIKEK